MAKRGVIFKKKRIKYFVKLKSEDETNISNKRYWAKNHRWRNHHLSKLFRLRSNAVAPNYVWWDSTERLNEHGGMVFHWRQREKNTTGIRTANGGACEPGSLFKGLLCIFIISKLLDLMSKFISLGNCQAKLVRNRLHSVWLVHRLNPLGC